MPECDYCEDSFDGEEAYLEHLQAEHERELGPIERRRVGTDDDGGGLPTGPLVIGSILVVTVGVVGATFVLTGNGAPSGIGQAGSAHYHGTIQMSVLGDTVDFTQQKFQLQADRFHFEGDGRWHAHATGVTLGFAMETLGIRVSPDRVVFEGTEYSEAEGYEVTIQVNGNTVSPGDYVLQNGDRVEITVAES